MEKITMSKKSELSVNEAFDLFIKKCRIKNLSSQTIVTYNNVMNTFRKFMDCEEPISGVDSDTMDEFIIWIRENTSANDTTTNMYLRQMRAFLYFCMDNRYMDSFKIRMIKTEQKIKETYSDLELEKLLAKPDVNTCSFSTFKTWVFENYLLASGNRLSTALNLRIKDIDFANGVIRLQKTKNRKQQIIPLSATLADILQEYLIIRGGEPDDYVFCNDYGAQASSRSYQLLVKRYNQKRGVEKTSCHLFRHTFAKSWIMAGGDMFRLQKILGHSDLTVTKQYVNMFAQDLQMDFERFNPLDNLKSKNTKNKIQM